MFRHLLRSVLVDVPELEAKPLLDIRLSQVQYIWDLDFFDTKRDPKRLLATEVSGEGRPTRVRAAQLRIGHRD